MEIKIGGATSDFMSLLEIRSYPFTSSELSTAFRTKLKEVHPDMNNGGDKKQNAETRRVIEAYKYLKNLAIDPQGVNKTEDDIVEEETDIFALYEICPDCHGTKVTIFRSSDEACPYCYSFPSSLWFGGGTGFQYVPCKKCNATGKYKDKGVCYACNGMRIIKIRCRHCNGSGWYRKGIEEKRSCSKCNGKGKIKIDPWNPVIPKGAVLGKGR